MDEWIFMIILSLILSILSKNMYFFSYALIVFLPYSILFKSNLIKLKLLYKIAIFIMISGTGLYLYLKEDNNKTK